MGVLIFGSLNIDIVTYLKRMPLPGETVLGDRFETFPGGKGLNQAVAAARAGGQVTMVGVLGSDANSEELKRVMDVEKINNEHVRRIEGACGTAVIEVDQEGQNRIIVISAANSDLKSSDISESLLKSITNKKILLSQLESPITEVQKVFSRAKEQNFYTILNPAPASKIDDNFYKFIDLFIPNQFEAEYFTNIKVVDFASAVQSGKKLIDLGVGSALITRGEEGAVLVQKGFEKNFEAFKVRTVDTTAAGDAFCGALAVGLSEGLDLESSINFASAAGALSVQSKGATVSLPKRDSIINLLTIKKGN
jgi:ribokinase